MQVDNKMAFDFEYATTRVKGMKSKLLGETKMRQLLEVKSIPEMVQLLEESDYKDEFVFASAKYNGMELVMRAIHENFKDSLQKLIKINPEEGQYALKLLLQDYEIQNITNLIAAKANDLPLSDTDLTILDKEGQKLVGKLSAAKTVPEMIKILRATEYRGAMKKSERDFEKTQDFRFISRSLNAYYFDKLQQLKGSGEGLLWKLLEMKTRTRNLMIFLRVKKSLPNADARKFVIDRRDRLMNELAKISEYEKILERVGQKYPSVQGALAECEKTKSLAPLEIALEKDFVRKIRSMLRVSVLDFGVVLGYLYLKEMEVSAIRKIAYAKQYGFSDELKGMIFSFNA